MEKILHINHIHRDTIGAKMGMWLFIFSEILFFGGLFLFYAVFRFKFSEGFSTGAKELNVIIGFINTIVLLTSSFSVALSISAIEKGKKRISILFLTITIILGTLFLINKYFEWKAKIKHGLFPGSELLSSLPQGETAFFNLYYVMTGVHALHVFIGIVIFTVLLTIYIKEPRKKILIHGEKLNILRGERLLGTEIDESIKTIILDIRYKEPEKSLQNIDGTKLFNAGLYWHFVDIVWIFLFPLFYLIT